ncbi:MAG: transposase [bacterium]
MHLLLPNICNHRSTCPTCRSGGKDLSIFKTNLTLLNKFLNNFTPCFTRKQMAIFILVVYALFKDYKRNSLEAMAKATNTNYQKLQYFISDSKWDLPAIKQKRLEIIQQQRTTASTKNGFIGIDDTGCPKPFAKKTQGAKWQHCGPLKREEICNVAVASAFVSQTKHFPIDIIPYLPADEFKDGKDGPEFKDKIQIAIELFDNAIDTLDVSGITFDSWYASTKFLEHIHKKEKSFFSEIKSNRNVFTLLNRVPFGKFNGVNVPSRKKDQLYGQTSLLPSSKNIIGIR